MSSEEKDIWQKVFDKYQEKNSMKLSDGLEQKFEDMVAKHKKRENNFFFQPTFKYVIAGILLFIVFIFYFSNNSKPTLNSPKFIAEKSDSSQIINTDSTIITNKKIEEELEKVIEQPKNLLASNYNPINFEDNSVLNGYYGEMRASVSCVINSPKHGSIFEYKEKGSTILFNGVIEDGVNRNLELLIKVYLGSNQKPQLKKVIVLSENNHFSFSEKFTIPGQYSWKIIAESEIVFAGNFFIGKPPAK